MGVDKSILLERVRLLEEYRRLIPLSEQVRAICKSIYYQLERSLKAYAKDRWFGENSTYTIIGLFLELCGDKPDAIIVVWYLDALWKYAWPGVEQNIELQLLGERV